ncbi:MAG: XRE family transcriptional regulator [Acinetobacter sp.]|nr:MAG: XRE family transcriptional regulator [Acinetobacter sp.]
MTRSIYTDAMIALQLWLKSQRQAKKLTMRSLAERMARPHSFIQRVEQGERRLDAVEYVWYCTALGISPHVGIDIIMQNMSSPSPKM